MPNALFLTTGPKKRRKRRTHRAGKGKRFTFHGAFSTKADAKRKERSEGTGAFIRRVKIKGHFRYVVMRQR